MQVVIPIDVENALATELDARIAAPVHAAPAPDDIGAGSVVIESLGGTRQTAVSDLFDVVAYCYADSYADAMALGTSVSGEIRAIQSSGPAVAGVEWTTADANPPYGDPDPDRPTLRRATVRATVAARGVPID
jgi:hypothetical protein